MSLKIGMGHEPRMGVQSLGTKSYGMDYPLKPPEGTSLRDALTLAQRYPAQTLAPRE